MKQLSFLFLCGIAFGLAFSHCAETPDEPPSVEQVVEQSPIAPMETMQTTSLWGDWSKDQIQKYMVQMNREINASCTDCHNSDLTAVIKHKDITRSMIHLSRTFNVSCTKCHEGMKGLNAYGKVSLQMKKKYSDTLNVPCSYCHTPGTPFQLNDIGRQEKMRLLK